MSNMVKLCRSFFLLAKVLAFHPDICYSKDVWICFFLSSETQLSVSAVESPLLGDSV